MTQEEEQTGNSQTNIDPGILTVLNITPEDLKQHAQNNVEKQRFIEGMKQKGAREYERAKPGHTGKVWVELGAVSISVETKTKDNFIPSKHEVPDLVVSNWKSSIAQHPTVYEKHDMKKLNTGVQAFIEGWGTRALEANDWQTVISAFDVITEGGIMQRQDIISRLADLNKENSSTRVEIAETIQKRVILHQQAQSPEP